MKRSFGFCLAAIAGAMLGAPALADQPQPWQMGLQEAASPGMAGISSFHHLLLVIISVIVLFVLGLLVYVSVRYNEKANPTPSRVTHNTLVEVVWTIAPILILVVIAIPSFRLLYVLDRVPDGERAYYGEVITAPELTLKATGYQWYWEYHYDDSDLEFVANVIEDEDTAKELGVPRLLGADVPVVLPVGEPIRLQVTAADVLHNWAMPAFGIKLDAAPGRLNETWFRIDKPGVYFGQCSELCGARHAFMPIMVVAVDRAKYDAWRAAAEDDPEAAGYELVAAALKDEATRVAALSTK